ncbi:MAG TPA: response regulator [Ktedonobacteraceae bacterium]|nr:response regulator [Ktedonobacteraceae bacterium]
MANMLLERQPTTDQMDAMWDLRQENSDICMVKSILVVEDNPALGNLLREILQDETTCRVVLVSSGEAALNTLQMVRPQLFLLDYCLPGMHGLELVDQIRSMQGYEQTPILLMSAAAALPQGNIAKQHLRCLQKPFDLDKLLELVEELLAV